MDEAERYEEAVIEREFAAEAWATLRDSILAEGGVRLTKNDRQDYRDLPICLRRRNGLPIDVMAAQFEIDYADDFVAQVSTAFERYQKAQRPLPRLGRHEDLPTVQRLLNAFYDVRSLYRAATAEFGGANHPAVSHIAQTMRECRRDYRSACRQTGAVPAPV